MIIFGLDIFSPSTKREKTREGFRVLVGHKKERAGRVESVELSITRPALVRWVGAHRGIRGDVMEVALG
jgi:hypothetical protein